MKRLPWLLMTAAVLLPTAAGASMLLHTDFDANASALWSNAKATSSAKAVRAASAPSVHMFTADNPDIQYTGRIDFTNPKRPRFSAPGVYLQARFRGPFCAVAINDEVLWGKSHNYLEIVVDDKPPVRVQTTGAVNFIPVASDLSDGLHTLTVCKDTESGIGALEFVGLQCAGLVPLPPKPKHKMEFIGDSITCGAGNDLSVRPCGQGEWYDQNNAYLSYGPTTARLLHAQWQLTAVSGIGLAHSAGGLLPMPDVFDKMNLRANMEPWDFSKYQPDVVTICLGQNDGVGDPAAFETAYIRFIGQVRKAYPHAQILCLTSPMGDDSLTAWLKDRLTHVAAQENAQGDPNVHAFFFSRSYYGGCGGHPNVAEHALIAQELSADIQKVLQW